MSRCGFCSENGHNLKTCNNDRIGLLLLRMRCKTEKSERTGNLFVLLGWLTTFPLKVLKMILCKKYGMTSNYNKQELIAMIMEMEFPDSEQAFWRVWFTHIVHQSLPLENPQENELLIHNICEVSQWSEEQLIGFSNSTLFDIFLACLKKNGESVKFNIQVIIEDIINDEGESEDKDCSICLEYVDKQHILKYNCSHEFCCECSLQHIKSKTSHPICALCRTPINSITTSLENCEKIGDIIV